jgi:hypothetical protein
MNAKGEAMNRIAEVAVATPRRNDFELESRLCQPWQPSVDFVEAA